MGKILLLNFTEAEASAITKTGHSVERGFLGRYESDNHWPFQIPHPFYEYDVLVYSSDVRQELSAEFQRPENLLGVKGCLNALTSFDTPPHVRISFIGDATGLPVLLHGGISLVKLSAADGNVSEFVELSSTRTFAITEMENLIFGLRKNIRRVGHFLDFEEQYGFSNFATLLSRSGAKIAAYGVSYDGGQGLPRYLVLPQLHDNAKAVVETLQTLENVFPSLFPEKTKNVWLNSEEFMLSDEKMRDRDIQLKIAESIAAIEQMKIEREHLAEANNFIRRLLVATEDPKAEPSQRLSAAVHEALKFLGFGVEDIDQKTRTAIRKEDFWVSDGDFFAIAEVTGTVNVNPKAKEFNDILGRMTTIFKRQTDLIPKDVKNLSGLLVLNYDCERHPSKRPKAYTGDLGHIVEAAVEQDIGILSTVDLHRIVVDVKEKRLTSEEARSVLKQFGRIEYPAKS